jgi:hypothetical protein
MVGHNDGIFNFYNIHERHDYPFMEISYKALPHTTVVDGTEFENSEFFTFFF